MQTTIAQILLWGGAGGIVLFSLIGVICWVVLHKKGRDLLNVIQQDYE